MTIFADLLNLEAEVALFAFSLLCGLFALLMLVVVAQWILGERALRRRRRRGIGELEARANGRPCGGVDLVAPQNAPVKRSVGGWRL